MSGIYDGAFRAMVNDCKRMLLPLLNEVFDEEYAGDEQIELRPNEYFIDQQDEPDQRRITEERRSHLGFRIRRWCIFYVFLWEDEFEAKRRSPTLAKRMKIHVEWLLEELLQLEAKGEISGFERSLVLSNERSELLTALASELAE